MICLRTENLSIAIQHKIFCQQLNLSIQNGEIWGILGPNGCGKTTFLHVLAGLKTPAQGDIFVQEKNIRSLSSRTIAKSLGILFQDFTQAFTQTVWEYCEASRFAHRAYFKKTTQENQQIVRQALQRMQLENFIGCPISQLSGGEKRRLAIATLLAQNPKIYLLDEPTNHLDVRYQINVLKHFQQLAKENHAAIIMSLHDINLAQAFCDQIILLLPEGKSMQGTCQQMLTSENLSLLYKHPIEKVNDEKTHWQAALC